ncbi:MAG TPA: glutathione S-transferase family protein [Kofleriaceae bacterium]|nr:glutathione S-transferase family protein [Kofleriaceae bacterium]
MALTLFVGSKRYSSWSLRPYLALAHTGAAFETRTILLDRPTTAGEIAKVNPAGRVPVLHHDDLVVWDSLAICEYVHELFPAAQLWPSERSRRARARAISAEMHAGFAALRLHMSMDLGANRRGEGRAPEALADAARIQTIWREELEASGGPFLFGSFTIADAMYAPVTTRFVTYALELPPVLQRYVDAIAALPAMQAWHRDAAAEPVSR